jgi:PAS domain S-box-containing protein
MQRSAKSEGRIREMINENLFLNDKLEFHELYNEFFNSWEIFRNHAGKLVYISPVFEKLTGYSCEDFISGENEFINLVHPDDLEKVTKASQQQSNKQSVSDLFFRIFDKEKNILYLSVDSQPVYNNEKEFFGTRISCLDVSKLKLSEIALNESQIKLSTVFNNSFEGIILVDYSGRIIDWNRGTEKITGFSKDEVLGEFVWEVQYSMAIPEVKKSTSEKAFKNVWDEKVFCLNINEQASAVGKLLNSAGEIKFVEDLVSPVMINDKKFFTIFQRDITDRQKTSLIIQQQNDELTKLNTDKDRFMSILAHDLKSPFSSVLGFLDLLEEDNGIYSVKERRDIIASVNSSAHKTFNLLEDLLLWINARAGKLNYEPQKLVFSAILNEILVGLEPMAAIKNIRIIQQASAVIYLSADKNILKTVLRNLVNNAIKFTNRNGLIIIDIKPDLEFATVMISDNGTGIEPEDLVKLFDPLHRVSSPGTDKESGTGLGLLLCKEFVEKAGGRIWVESESGKGSKFSFTVPIFCE